MSQDSLHRRLRALIGNRFRYAGDTWVLIEVLTDADAVVLRNVAPAPGPVQSDLYGAPLRRAQETLTLPVSGDDGGYSDELGALLRQRIGA